MKILDAFVLYVIRPILFIAILFSGLLAILMLVYVFSEKQYTGFFFALFFAVICWVFCKLLKIRTWKELITPRYIPAKQTFREDPEFELMGKYIWESQKGIPITFTYSDSGGTVTKRKIILHSISRKDCYSRSFYYFHGDCQLRNDWRSFNCLNITNLQDDNGLPFDVFEFIGKLIGYPALNNIE